jgi:nucleotide-binding universal stress UspA family protein
MYRKILLTLDGSELAERAIPHSRALAQAFDAAVVVLEVVVRLQGPAAYGIEAARTRDHRDALRSVTAASDQLMGDGVRDVSVVVAEGAAGETIVRSIDEAECDLVVMATHGRSGIGRVLLGSVAEYVARHSLRAPVLLVRVPDGAPRDPQ